jgi:hypothetical protein
VDVVTMGDPRDTDDTRAQAYTLEGVAAALLLLASIAFVLEATAVTPLAASATTEHTEVRDTALADGLLDAAVENGSLDAVTRYWDPDDGTFHGSAAGEAYTTGPPTVFGAMLNRTFLDRGYGVDVTLYYTDDGDTRRLPVVDTGEPSDDAVSARRTVTLTDDDELLTADGSQTGTTLAGTSSYFAADSSSTSPLYHVVTVEVVVWPS